MKPHLIQRDGDAALRPFATPLPILPDRLRSPLPFSLQSSPYVDMRLPAVLLGARITPDMRISKDASLLFARQAIYRPVNVALREPFIGVRPSSSRASIRLTPARISVPVTASSIYAACHACAGLFMAFRSRISRELATHGIPRRQRLPGISAAVPAAQHFLRCSFVSSLPRHYGRAFDASPLATSSSASRMRWGAHRKSAPLARSRSDFQHARSFARCFAGRIPRNN